MTVRVLIVDDDPTYRKILSKTFHALGVSVVGAVGNLESARRVLAGGQIDLVTLDVVLDGESGLDLLPWLQEHQPRTLTALITAGTVQEASQAVDALLLGVSTLILKPSGPGSQEKLSEALTQVVRGMVAEVEAAPGTQAGVPPRRQTRSPRPPTEAVRVRDAIAIGASTGGPPVVLRFLSDLPPAFDVPILITQHLPPSHVPYFVEQLSRHCGRTVRLAHHGELVRPGVTYVAGDGRHLKVARQAGGLVLLQDDGPEEHYCRPAVDPLFRSVAATCGAASIGVVMTGMGSDGAEGAKALQGVGASVIVQDKATSVVWGMPGATVAAGAASEVVPARELAAAVLRRTAGWSLAAERAEDGARHG